MGIERAFFRLASDLLDAYARGGVFQGLHEWYKSIQIPPTAPPTYPYKYHIWDCFHRDVSHRGQCEYDTSLTTGVLKWKYLTGHWVSAPPAIDKNGVIYVGSYDKHLYALNPDGTLKWKYLTGDYIHSSPAIDKNGVIYVGSNDKYLYAIV